MVGDGSTASVADSVTSTEFKNEPLVGLAETTGTASADPTKGIRANDRKITAIAGVLIRLVLSLEKYFHNTMKYFWIKNTKSFNIFI